MAGVQAPDLDYRPPQDLVVSPHLRRRRRGRRIHWGLLLGLSGVAALGVGLAVWGAMWLRRTATPATSPEPAAGSVLTISDYNCALLVPPPPWKQDDAVKLHFRVNLAMSRQHPSNHLALFLKDYKTSMPTEGELRREALGKLDAYFGSPEWELKPDREILLGGQPARVIEFAGTDPEHVGVTGECVILAHRGYAYWFFTWGPEEDKGRLLPQWQALREGFQLLGGREGWRALPRPLETATGERAAYRLRYPRELWKKVDPQAFDPAADLALEAFTPERGSRPHASLAAHLIVLVLPRAVDLKAATAQARDHVVKQLEADGQARVTLTPVADKGTAAGERDDEVGVFHGRLLKLHVSAADGGSLDRFMVLAVVCRPDANLVLLGNCEWQRRDFWEPEFLQVIGGLKPP
jgi:hypothetical protein